VENFDYIIIGAGSAGCVLADRLSASGRDRVLILEAGGTDRRFWIKTPIGYGRTFAEPAVNWKYQTCPNPGLNGRSIYWPRGRVLGGSSSINALVYCRGMPADFDDWRQMGNVGWGWDDVRPYFERSERHVDAAGNASGAGPLDVKDVTPFLHPMRQNWLGAAAELGLPVTDDFNGPHPEGLGCYQVTIRNGMRRSAADRFERLGVHNLEVVEPHARCRTKDLHPGLDQLIHLAFPVIKSLLHCHERTIRNQRHLSLVGVKIGIARAHRQPITFTDRCHRHDFQIEIQIGDHPLNRAELLKVFLAEQRDMRLDDIEELGDD